MRLLWETLTSGGKGNINHDVTGPVAFFYIPFKWHNKINDSLSLFNVIRRQEQWENENKVYIINLQSYCKSGDKWWEDTFNKNGRKWKDLKLLYGCTNTGNSTTWFRDTIHSILEKRSKLKRSAENSIRKENCSSKLSWSNLCSYVKSGLLNLLLNLCRLLNRLHRLLFVYHQQKQN